MSRALSERGAAALAYARKDGFDVFPAHWVSEDRRCSCRDSGCDRVGKHPLTPRGLKDATRDESRIRAWWNRTPDANVAIRTGHNVVIDIDPHRGGVASLAALETAHETLPATRTAKTGGGGSHIYFSADASQPIRSGVDVLGPGLDIRGHGGYVIAPPSTHASGRTYRWTREGPPQVIPTWLARRCSRSGGSDPTSSVHSIPEIFEVVGCERGTRNNTLNRVAFKVGLQCRSGDLPLGEAWEALVAAAGMTSPPMDAREARRTIESGLRAGMETGLRGRQAPARTPKLTRLDTKQMLHTTPPAVPWIIEPVLADGSLTIVAGSEGEGKSMLSLGLACSVAGGEAVAGFAPSREGRVLIVDAENAPGEIHRRVRALGLTEDASDSVTFYAAEGLDLRSGLSEISTLLDDEETTDLLVLDSFRSLWGGDENNSEEVAPVLDRLRNLGRSRGVAILLLHHTTKDGRSYRGSSAIGASAELMFVLGRAEGDPDPARRFLRCRKSRPAPEPSTRWIRLSAELGAIVIDEADAPEHVATEVRPVRDRLVGQVVDLLRDSRSRRRADIARAVGRDAKDRTVGRVLIELVSAGQITKDVDGAFRHSGSGSGGTA